MYLQIVLFNPVITTRQNCVRIYTGHRQSGGIHIMRIQRMERQRKDKNIQFSCVIIFFNYFV